MLSNRILFYCTCILGALILTFLGGCQGHLPPLETAPNQHGPKTEDIVHHIECELATIVNYDPSSPTAKTDNPRLYDRIDHNKPLKDLLEKLRTYHFVATAQLSLEVTDTEGFNPSLAYTNASGQGVFSLGGQLSGTQDRSLTINYAIDLQKLYDPKVPKTYGKQFCPTPAYDRETQFLQGVGLSGAIAGDLGLADIVADGLLGLQVAASRNIYTSSGPVPPAIARRISLTGKVILPGVDDKYTVDSLIGTLLLAPQAAGAITQGNATLSGLLTLAHDGTKSKFVVNWSGNIVPPNSTSDDKVYFSLSGNLTPLLSNISPITTKLWGYNPTITLTGTIDKAFDLKNLVLYGVLGAAANSDFEKKPPIIVALAQDPKGKEAAGPPSAGAAPQASKGGGASGAAGTGTSFGSLVDFTLVYGANGGPNWTFKRFKGPSGATTPFLSATHTNLDSLAISFAASCQDFTGVHANFADYWSSIGACDDINSALEQGAAAGGQNNYLMILRSFPPIRQ